MWEWESEWECAWASEGGRGFKIPKEAPLINLTIRARFDPSWVSQSDYYQPVSIGNYWVSIVSTHTQSIPTNTRLVFYIPSETDLSIYRSARFVLTWALGQTFINCTENSNVFSEPFGPHPRFDLWTFSTNITIAHDLAAKAYSPRLVSSERKKSDRKWTN